MNNEHWTVCRFYYCFNLIKHKAFLEHITKLKDLVFIQLFNKHVEAK